MLFLLARCFSWPEWFYVESFGPDLEKATAFMKNKQWPLAKASCHQLRTWRRGVRACPFFKWTDWVLGWLRLCSLSSIQDSSKVSSLLTAGSSLRSGWFYLFWVAMGKMYDLWPNIHMILVLTWQVTTWKWDVSKYDVSRGWCPWAYALKLLLSPQEEHLLAPEDCASQDIDLGGSWSLGPSPAQPIWAPQSNPNNHCVTEFCVCSTANTNGSYDATSFLHPLF